MGKKHKKKLPKEIGGVKIPRKLRKKGGKLLAALDTPVGRELAVAGLMAAAVAISKRKAAHAAAPHEQEPGSAAAEPARAEEKTRRNDAHEAGAQFANAAAGVAAAALDRWLKGRRAPEPPRTPEPPPGSTATH